MTIFYHPTNNYCHKTWPSGYTTNTQFTRAEEQRPLRRLAQIREDGRSCCWQKVVAWDVAGENNVFCSNTWYQISRAHWAVPWEWKIIEVGDSSGDSKACTGGRGALVDYRKPVVHARSDALRWQHVFSPCSQWWRHEPPHSVSTPFNGSWCSLQVLYCRSNLMNAAGGF